jgi:hypothetical protein
MHELISEQLDRRMPWSCASDEGGDDRVPHRPASLWNFSRGTLRLQPRAEIHGSRPHDMGRCRRTVVYDGKDGMDGEKSEFDENKI